MGQSEVKIPLAGALSARQRALGFGSRQAFAAHLGVSKPQLAAWQTGRKFPARKYWPRLTAAGICTAAELAAWRPRRPRGYSLRGARVYSLAEYAAK